MARRDERTLLTIARCPKCGGAHDLLLSYVVDAGVMVFGGASTSAQQAPEWDVIVQCPVEGRRYHHTVAIPVGAGERVVSAQVDDQADAAILTTEERERPRGNGSAEPDPLAEEFTAWVTGSLDRALDFVKTMSTTAATLVPVYFAVIGYLKPAGQGGSWQVFGLAAPVLFVATVLLCILCLRPRLLVTHAGADFEALRRHRLQLISRWLTAATVTFVSGLACALVIWARLAFRY